MHVRSVHVNGVVYSILIHSLHGIGHSWCIGHRQRITKLQHIAHCVGLVIMLNLISLVNRDLSHRGGIMFQSSPRMLSIAQLSAVSC